MKITRVAMTAVMMLMAGLAYAGAQSSIPVVVSDGFAEGDQYSARTAKNDVERIGCGARTLRMDDGSYVYFGFCQAADSDGNTAFCLTFDPLLTREIGAIGEYGYIAFGFSDGECRFIRWSKQSQYLPNFTVKGGN